MIAAWLGDVITSRLFWEVRASTAMLGIIAIWIGIIMAADTVLFTPSEYLPILVVTGLVVTIFLTFLRARTAYNDKIKSDLRTGKIKEAPGFGLDYMSAYVGTIVLGVVGAFLFPGIIYESIQAKPDLAGCFVVALVWSVVVGIKGATKASEVVDLFRDAAKIKALEAEAKKPEQ